MNLKDLYEGYEGEPELKIISKDSNGKIQAVLHLWIGFFDNVVRLIEPNKNGFWEGIPLYYHTAKDWEDVEIWQVQELFVEQLKNINIELLDSDYQKAYWEILKIFTDTITGKGKIYFDYF